ncbi:MAG TPA: N-6 DNA methylase, partial [Vicinamibacterales bacterium]|nr:N-6 DNA methylase [Vicinamibacterales bacterium]
MIPGVRGRLLAASFIRDVLPTMAGVGELPRDVTRDLARWCARIESTLGTASSVRAIADVAIVPLLDLLGLTVARRADAGDACWIRLAAGSRSASIAIVTPWGARLEGVWRSAVVEAIGADARWCFCSNGLVLRLVDARRTWSRDYLEFDLQTLGRDVEAQAVLWAVARGEAMASEPPLLDRAVDLSIRHGVEVCRALGVGVLEALEVLLGAMARGGSRSASVLWEQSLTVLYRVLFLLFAEARGLVPLWHPVYRERYSVETIAATLLDGRPCRGLWRAMQAISRLAHSGCTAGELRVTAFNGRLFAPAQAAAFDGRRVSDEALSRALMSVSSTPVDRRGGRARIAYRDLDVEQLGAVYERVLEYEPSTCRPTRHSTASSGPVSLTRTRDARKSSGTFYTPRAVTAFLVRRTLEPLVNGRDADGILTLRVLDPAMGSGAFLVAACRYLASAAEQALVREGRWHAHDVTPADRASLRREIASRCLFGVDLNPMAVQLARLSLWLATLAADKPLSFLDHHLLAGHSLVGATPDVIHRQPGGGRSTSGRHRRPLPLFDDTGLPSALEHAARVLTKVSAEPDDSAAIVRAKERTVFELHARESSLGKWTEVLDAWCASWFWSHGTPPDRGTFLDLMNRALGRPCALPHHVAGRLLDQSRDVASRLRFVHWPLAFPDVFLDLDASNRPAGFDAVIGNPPWDMIRGDSGEGDARADRRAEARALTGFVRGSGIYQVASRAHLNLYQLFLERSLQLVAPGGRIGFVLPSGLVSDTGAAPLRRHLFDRAEVDEITGFDNQGGIFPVHRSVRFVLLTCSTGRPTDAVRCRFGLTRPDQLDAPGRPLVLSRRFLARLSGEDDLGIPELASERDLAIVEGISAVTPRLGSNDGWHAEFGRELNASDDRGLFVPISRGAPRRPVIEGKQIEPFRALVGDCRFELRPGAQTGRRVGRRARLAYRDIASATNRLTLIAAIVPAHAVTTHTLFCLRTPLPEAEQHVLCALLNSYVANYLVRFRVNTHVTVSLVSRLPVPIVRRGDAFFERVSALAGALVDGAGP